MYNGRNYYIYRFFMNPENSQTEGSDMDVHTPGASGRILSDQVQGSATPPRSGKGAGLLVVVFVLLATVAGAAYAYTQGYLDVLIGGSAPFGQDTVVSETVQALSQVDSGVFVFGFAMEAVEREADVVPFPSEVFADDRSMDRTIKDLSRMNEEIPSDFSLRLGANSTFSFGDKESQGTRSQFTMDLLLDDFTVNGDVEFITEGLEALYVRVNRLPSLFFDIGDAKGEWIAISKDYIEAAGMPTQFNLSPETEEEKEELEEVKQIGRDFLALIKKHQVLTAPETPEIVEVGDEKLYKYKLQAQADKSRAFMQDVNTLFRTNEILSRSGEVPFSDEHIEMYSNQAYIDYSNVSAPWFVYVTKDGEVRQISLEARLVFDDEDTVNDKQVNINFTFRLENINEPVKVEAPEGAVPLEEMAKKVPVLQSMLDSIEASQKRKVQVPFYTITRSAEFYLSEKGSYPSDLSMLKVFIKQQNSYLTDDYFNQYDNVLYATVNKQKGYVACSQYNHITLYYCVTDRGSQGGDVDLEKIGDPSSSLADMYSAIVSELESNADIDIYNHY